MLASIADPLLRSMNTHVNMLYVDQPNSVGFSYDAVLNSTFDTLFIVPEALNDTSIVSFDEYPEGVPEANSTLWYGSFPSQNILHTANTTAIAARTLWHFAQGFFGSFPEYKTCNKDISLWGNSYGATRYLSRLRTLSRKMRRSRTGSSTAAPPSSSRSIP